MNSLELKERDTYIMVDIICDNTTIGKAEIKLPDRMLCGFDIFEPFQNKGYGQDALNKLIKKYDVKSLEVKSDNERAKHIYEKFGFNFTGNGYFEMILE